MPQPEVRAPHEPATFYNSLKTIQKFGLSETNCRELKNLKYVFGHLSKYNSLTIYTDKPIDYKQCFEPNAIEIIIKRQ